MISLRRLAEANGHPKTLANHYESNCTLPDALQTAIHHTMCPHARPWARLSTHAKRRKKKEERRKKKEGLLFKRRKKKEERRSSFEKKTFFSKEERRPSFFFLLSSFFFCVDRLHAQFRDFKNLEKHWENKVLHVPIRAFKNLIKLSKMKTSGPLFAKCLQKVSKSISFISKS